jgi:hypothetical protein
VSSRVRTLLLPAYLIAVTAYLAATPTSLYPLYEERWGFGSATVGLVFAAYSAGTISRLWAG